MTFKFVSFVALKLASALAERTDFSDICVSEDGRLLAWISVTYTGSLLDENDVRDILWALEKDALTREAA